MEKIRQIMSLAFRHKWKFVLMMASTVVFLFLLFPLGDLSDLITAQVAKLTNNAIYLQFDNMRLSLFPDAGIALDEVHVEGQGFPPLKSQELVLTPSLMSLLTQKPAGTISARGFMKGQIEVSMKPGTKSDNGVERQKITLSAQKLSLAEIRNLAQLPIQLKGNLDVESQALADLSFQEQPDMDVTLKIDRFEIPSSNLQTIMGPMTLPELKLSSVELKGRLSAGKFLIENGRIGKETDEVRGTIKGNIGMMIQNRNGQLAPQIGAYSFDIDLQMRKTFQDRANLFLTFIDNFKTPLADGAQYKFKVASPDPQMPPNISALR